MNLLGNPLRTKGKHEQTALEAFFMSGLFQLLATHEENAHGRPNHLD